MFGATTFTSAAPNRPLPADCMAGSPGSAAAAEAPFPAASGARRVSASAPDALPAASAPAPPAEQMVEAEE